MFYRHIFYLKGSYYLITKFKKIDKTFYYEILFYFALFCIFLIWSMMLRFDDAPDELGRYSICQYIFNHGTLPHGGDMEIRMEAWGFSYAFQPILPYIIGAFFMKVTSLFTSNAYFYLIAARFVSVICGVVMAVFVRKIAKRVFTGYAWQWIFTFFVMLLPQCMFMFVYVNTDSMALLSCAIIFYAWLYGYDTNWNYKACILLSLGIILNAMSYYNAYAFILCSIIVFVVHHISFVQSKRKLNIEWNSLLKKGCLIAFLVFLGTGWWFIRSYILYDGDFLGLRIRDEFAEKYATTEYLKPSQAKTYYNAGLSVFLMLKQTDYIRDLYISFIGQFGNMSIVLPMWMYYGYTAIFCTGVLGLFLRNRDKVTKLQFSKKDNVAFHLSLILCIIIPIVLCTYSSYVTDYQPQGRYILPMLIPIMYYITVGMNRLFDWILRDEFLYQDITRVLRAWFVITVFFFMKDIVFLTYWDTFVKFIIAL